MPFFESRVLSYFIILFSVLPLPVHSQSAVLENPAELEKGIEIITVTAQKRVERLSKIPVAVSVLSSQQIESSYANNFESLQNLIPSVSFRKGTTNRNSAIAVRGIGTISFSIAVEPSVSTVVDGVVLARSGQAFVDLYDVERVEVLRGPQGTLFGKNASAGVVNISTKKPSSAVETQFELSMFQGNEHRIKAKVQGALNGNVDASLMLFKSAYDGNLTNVYNYKQVNGYDKKGFRTMFDIEVSNDAEFLFIIENMSADDGCCADIEGLHSGRHLDSEALPNSQGIVDGIADFDLNQRRIDHDFESATLDKTLGLSGQYTKELKKYLFTSISAYIDWQNTEYREGDFTSIGGQLSEPVFDATFQLHDTGIQTWRQLSQEFRLANVPSASLDWQIGAFYLGMDSQRLFSRDASCLNNNEQLSSDISTYLALHSDIKFPDEQQVASIIAKQAVSCNANDIVSADANMTSKLTNWALFGDGKYHLSNDLRLLFGARYTVDRVSYSHVRINKDMYGRTGVGVKPANEDSRFFGETDNGHASFKLGGQYDFDDESMLYLVWSQGYKGAGFNVFYNMTEKDTLPISQETSDAYELGYKFSSHKIVFNLAAFKTAIKDFQANNFDNSTGITITRLTNAGNVSTQGVELDLIWQASNNLKLSVGLAKINAEIDEFFCPSSEDCNDRAGGDLPYSPEVKFTLFLNYITELNSMNIFWDASYSFTDEQKATLPDNYGNFSAAAILPSYSLLNASVTFSFHDDTYSIALIGKNLTDEKYYTSYSGDQFRYQVPRDADRYFGVQLRVSLSNDD